MILVDVLPAEVQLPDGVRLERVRVVLTNRRVRVWREISRQPDLVIDAAHDGIALTTRHPLIGQAMTWVTDAGELVVTRMRGCSCGSSLKAVQPPKDDATTD